jgi:hypothetical protein
MMFVLQRRAEKTHIIEFEKGIADVAEKIVFHGDVGKSKMPPIAELIKEGGRGGGVMRLTCRQDLLAVERRGG